jgi:hypothetical protein
MFLICKDVVITVMKLDPDGELKAFLEQYKLQTIENKGTINGDWVKKKYAEGLVQYDLVYNIQEISSDNTLRAVTAATRLFHNKITGIISIF